MFKDQKLICRDCSKEFIWTVGEQKFFAQKGFDKPPVRCLECRKKKKQRHQQSNIAPVSETMHAIKCKKCAKISQVPFQPQFPDDILCLQCFKKESKKEE